MKLFSTSLYCIAREWYENLPDATITTIKQFKETFLIIWGIQLEDIQVLLKILKNIKKNENETIRDFQDRFEDILYQIPESHHPEEKYLVHLYTHAILVHLGYPLSKRSPRMLDEAHNMAPRIEKNISLSEIRYLFT
jgi:hypothetical protein